MTNDKSVRLKPKSNTNRFFFLNFISTPHESFTEPCLFPLLSFSPSFFSVFYNLASEALLLPSYRSMLPVKSFRSLLQSLAPMASEPSSLECHHTVSPPHKLTQKIKNIQCTHTHAHQKLSASASAVSHKYKHTSEDDLYFDNLFYKYRVKIRLIKWEKLRY